MGFRKALSRIPLFLTYTVLATIVACLSFIQTAYAHPTSLITVENDSGTNLTSESIHQFLEAHENLFAGMILPSDTKLTLGSASQDGQKRVSRFMRFKNELFIVARPGFEKQDLYVLVHEYGHALFEKNLMHVSQLYKEIRPDLEKSESSAKDGREKLGSAFVRARKVFLLTSALHEFFADVVAVTYFQDPQAAKKTELFDDIASVPYSWEHLQQRDFNLASSPERTAAWEQALGLAIWSGNPYHILLPARWEFWLLFQSQILSADIQVRAKVISQTFAALERVLSQILLWDELQMGRPQFEVEQSKILNQLVLDELKKSFSFNALK
ncbi:hypothetical protein [Bdellovibrio sp. HCB2-146]|uniref:hypothetical protein n=1 Tax=Bdellovibrio sp. HCB2-146 TaxID=3394362 RepID=UPI0039BD732C